jgi:hypothetical protein
MITFVSAILMRGSPTLFAFEGLCRQAVRSGFILLGRWLMLWPKSSSVVHCVVSARGDRAGMRGKGNTRG